MLSMVFCLFCLMGSGLSRSHTENIEKKWKRNHRKLRPINFNRLAEYCTAESNFGFTAYDYTRADNQV